METNEGTKMNTNMLNKTVSLANGVEAPVLGLGTWLMDNDEAAAAVEAALKLGYRHVDTAQAYGNEAGVGRGIAASGIAREDVFVTTKVAAEHKDFESAAASIDASLAAAGLDYFDLVIIHSPQPWAKVNQSNDRYLEGNREAWRALEEAYAAGKVRAIGVSNFLEADLENILSSCNVKPMVNQVLAHVGNMPSNLVAWCKERGIVVEAYSPVAHGAVLDSPEIVHIAATYGVSVPQLCIRYCLQLGLIALPKTANPDHMAANANVDFEISAADMDALSALSISDYGEANVFPVYGGKM